MSRVHHLGTPAGVVAAPHAADQAVATALRLVFVLALTVVKADVHVDSALAEPSRRDSDSTALTFAGDGGLGPGTLTVARSCTQSTTADTVAQNRESTPSGGKSV